MEVDDSEHVLLDQSFLRIQSLTVFGSIHRHRSILLCDGWDITLSQHLWLGDCWLGRSIDVCISDATTARVENVLLLPVTGDFWIVCVCEFISTALDGMGDLCSKIHLCGNLSRIE